MEMGGQGQTSDNIRQSRRERAGENEQSESAQDIGIRA